MKKNITLYILSILVLGMIHGKVSAQEAASYQHYKINYHLINPGAMGMKGQVIMLNYINRWNSFPGNPQAFTATFNGMVSDNIGLGAMVLFDNLRSVNKTAGVLCYAYQLDIEETRLSIGVSARYERYKSQAYALVGDRRDPDDATNKRAARAYVVFDAASWPHAQLTYRLFASLTMHNLVRTQVDTDANTTQPERTLSKDFI